MDIRDPQLLNDINVFAVSLHAVFIGWMLRVVSEGKTDWIGRSAGYLSIVLFGCAGWMLVMQPRDYTDVLTIGEELRVLVNTVGAIGCWFIYRMVTQKKPVE